jgi:hypothetical protein
VKIMKAETTANNLPIAEARDALARTAKQFSDCAATIEDHIAHYDKPTSMSRDAVDMLNSATAAMTLACSVKMQAAVNGERCRRGLVKTSVS